jgi:hypothetical protein
MANQINNRPSCVPAHMKFDAAITWPLQQAGKQIVPLITSGKSVRFFDTITPRLLCVAQSIISFVFLPFKMIFAIFSGIDTIFNPTNPRALADLGYVLASVAIHAVLVPAGVILAFLPVSAIQEISKLRDVLRDGAQAFVRNANIGPLPPNLGAGGGAAPGGADPADRRQELAELRRHQRELIGDEIVDQLEGREGERRPAFAGPDAQPPPGAARRAPSPPPYNARVEDLRAPPPVLNAEAPGYEQPRWPPARGAFRFWSNDA